MTRAIVPRDPDRQLLILAQEEGGELAVPTAALLAFVRMGGPLAFEAAAIIGERVRKRRPKSFEPGDQGPRWDWVRKVQGALS